MSDQAIPYAIVLETYPGMMVKFHKGDKSSFQIEGVSYWGVCRSRYKLKSGKVRYRFEVVVTARPVLMGKSPMRAAQDMAKKLKSVNFGVESSKGTYKNSI